MLVLRIVDLGTDVPAETFVEKAEEIGADVIGMSALLTTTMPNMKDVIDVLNEKGLRDKYVVMRRRRACKRSLRTADRR